MDGKDLLILLCVVVMFLMYYYNDTAKNTIIATPELVINTDVIKKSYRNGYLDGCLNVLQHSAYSHKQYIIDSMVLDSIINSKKIKWGIKEIK
jgi:hypothetical protein